MHWYGMATCAKMTIPYHNHTMHIHIGLHTCIGYLCKDDEVRQVVVEVNEEGEIDKRLAAATCMHAHPRYKWKVQMHVCASEIQMHVCIAGTCIV